MLCSASCTLNPGWVWTPSLEGLRQLRCVFPHVIKRPQSGSSLSVRQSHWSLDTNVSFWEGGTGEFQPQRIWKSCNMLFFPMQTQNTTTVSRSEHREQSTNHLCRWRWRRQETHVLVNHSEEEEESLKTSLSVQDCLLVAVPDTFT